MPHVEINGLQTYYETYGKGESIVLLHNGFSCTKMWEEIHPRFAEAGYQVVLYDRRGYGRSEEGDDFDRFYQGESFREENVGSMALLMDELGLEKFHIVGQCEGGVVGVDFAGSYPDRVKTLTTASTMCISRTTMTVFNQEKFPPSFRDLPSEIQEKYVYWHGAERAGRFFELCTSPGGGAYGLEIFDLRKALKSVQCPTLVMYPDRGYFFEVEQGVEFYRHLSKGELAVFPRCGHNIHEHYPEEYVRQVLRFIARCEASAPV